MTNEWKILRGEKRCSKCEKQFEEKELYWSGLFDRSTEFERLDYCLDCWTDDTSEMFSFWQTRVPEKAEKKKLFVDDQVLIDFFYKLEGATDELKLNFRYILALVLMRKKYLKFEDVVRSDDSEILVLADKQSGAKMEVLNPQLDEEKIVALTEEVGKILNVEL